MYQQGVGALVRIALLMAAPVLAAGLCRDMGAPCRLGCPMGQSGCRL